MSRSFVRNGIPVLAILFSIVASGMAQGQQPTTTIKKAPITQTAAESGQEMYKAYCASCHGLSGKGDGPAVPALKSAPPDLTTLSKRNGGKFPDSMVATILKNGVNKPAHGSAEMPVWGPPLSAVSVNKSVVAMRIVNLSKYLESMQAP